MKSLFRNTLVKPGAVIALAVAGMLSGGAAQALGTASGTDITNLATLAYTVGTTVQTPIGSSAVGNTSGAGTATTFKVDNKVNLTVATVDLAAVSVVPGTNGVATFTVTNNGNSVQDFSLLAGFSLANGTTLFPGPGSVSSTFNPASCSAFVESGSPAGYQAGSDTATFIDELAPDASKTVYVVCPISLAQINHDGAVVSLTAEARASGVSGTLGAALTQTTGPDTAGVDIVFADAAGTDDLARNANHSSRDAYKVVTATLKVTKTAAPVCDPFNGSSNPKNIPGSFVSYTISIVNSGTTSAILTSIGDVLDIANLAIDANLITGADTGTPATSCSTASTAYTSVLGKGFKVVAPVARVSFASGAKYYTTANDADGVEFLSPNIAVNFATVLPSESGYAIGELKTGETVSVTFQAKIN